MGKPTKISAKSVIKASHDFLEALFSSTWTNPNPHSFRVSSLPYCPIMDLYERKYEPELKESFSKDFYTKIGTTVHEELMQELMPRVLPHGQGVFGNWHCLNCKKKYTFQTYQKATKRHVKTGCGTPLKYEEIAFTYEGLSGHVDLVWDHRGYFVAYEFKTTGASLFSQHEDYAAKWFPNGKHKIQIKTYCTLLYLLYKIRVVAYNIVYINRDRPDNKNMKRIGKTNRTGNYNYRCYSYMYTKDVYKEFKAHIQLACSNRNRVEIGLTTKSKALRKKMTTEILQNKPCKTRFDYENYMVEKFFGEKQCPYYMDKSCFKSKTFEDTVLTLMKYKPVKTHTSSHDE